MYSNHGTQVGTQNNDIGAVSQTDLIRGLVSSVAQANWPGAIDVH